MSIPTVQVEFLFSSSLLPKWYIIALEELSKDIIALEELSKLPEETNANTARMLEDAEISNSVQVKSTGFGLPVK